MPRKKASSKKGGDRCECVTQTGGTCMNRVKHGAKGCHVHPNCNKFRTTYKEGRMVCNYMKKKGECDANPNCHWKNNRCARKSENCKSIEDEYDCGVEPNCRWNDEKEQCVRRSGIHEGPTMPSGRRESHKTEAKKLLAQRQKDKAWYKANPEEKVRRKENILHNLEKSRQDYPDMRLKR
jgi:hypothetical protein